MIDQEKENFFKAIARTKKYHPISSPGLMMKIARSVIGENVLDVGFGGGLFAHILKAGWYHTESYKTYDIEFPIIFGLDVNGWNCKSKHNYDAFVQGVSNKIPLPDKSIHTIVSIENLEHLSKEEALSALKEFERVATHRIIISTPSPLSFITNTFQKRLDLLTSTTGRKIFIDKETYAILASAVHKHCISPIHMINNGYKIEEYKDEYLKTVIYTKVLSDSRNFSYSEPIIDKLFAKAAFPIEQYVSYLDKAFPFDADLITHFSNNINTVDDLMQLIKAESEDNYCIKYANLLAYSLKEEAEIPKPDKLFMQEFAVHR